MFIIAVVASFVIPELGTITDANVREQSNLFVGAIEYSCTQAVVRHRKYRLGFDLDKRTYWLEVQVQSSRFRALKQDLLGREKTLERGVSYKDIFVGETLYTKGVTYANFLPDGTMDRLMIQLETENEDEYRVVANEFTCGAESKPGTVDPKDEYGTDRRVKR